MTNPIAKEIYLNEPDADWHDSCLDGWSNEQPWATVNANVRYDLLTWVQQQLPNRFSETVLEPIGVALRDRLRGIETLRQYGERQRRRVRWLL